MNRRLYLKLSKEMMVLLAICGVIVLLSLLGLVWDFTSGLIGSLDGLMLLVVCLLMSGVFALVGLSLAKEAGLVKPLAALRRKQAAAEPAANAPESQRK